MATERVVTAMTISNSTIENPLIIPETLALILGKAAKNFLMFIVIVQSPQAYLIVFSDN